ncbi:MFS transporter [Rathayibacter sp. CAU 1779]
MADIDVTVPSSAPDASAASVQEPFVEPVRPTNPARYALGMFAGSLMSPMVSTYVAFFYVDRLGMSAIAFGVVMAIYGVLDAIGNPIYGYLSDRTRTKWGRRRPWILIGAPLWAVVFIALFCASGALQGAALIAYFAAFIVLTQSFDSLVTANYEALLPEIFTSERKRSIANSLRQGFQLVAMGVSVALVPLIASAIGYALTATVLGVVAAVVLVFVALGAHEDPRHYGDAAPKPSLASSLRSLARNRNFWIVAGANACYASVITLLMAGVAFFVKYVLGDVKGGSATYILATVLVMSMVFLIGWTYAVRRFGALGVWRVALVVLTLSFVPMYFAHTLVAAIASGAGIALGYSGVIATTDLLIARLIDGDSARTGVRREGIFTSAFAFTKRSSVVVKALAFVAMTGLFGYVSGDHPGVHAADAARFLMIVLPCVLCAVAAVLAWFVRFSREELVAAADV